MGVTFQQRKRKFSITIRSELLRRLRFHEPQILKMNRWLTPLFCMLVYRVHVRAPGPQSAGKKEPDDGPIEKENDFKLSVVYGLMTTLLA